MKTKIGRVAEQLLDFYKDPIRVQIREAGYKIPLHKISRYNWSGN